MPLRWIMLTFKNIGKNVKYHPALYIFLFFVQIACCIAVFVSCGMAYNLNYTAKEEDSLVHTFSFTFIEEKDNVALVFDGDDLFHPQFSETIDGKTIISSSHEFKDAIEIKDARKMIDQFVSMIEPLGIDTVVLFIYPGKIVDTNKDPALEYIIFLPGFGGNSDLGKTGIDKRFIDSDKNIMLAPLYDIEGNKMDSLYELGESVNIHGTDYTVVGDYGWYYIPYKSLPEDFAVYNINISFEKGMTSDDIDYVVEKANQVFGTHIKQERLPPPYKPVDLTLTNMLFIISLTVMLIVLMAVSKLFIYLLSKRKQTLSVMRLCGCKKRQAFLIYIVEAFLTTAVSETTGFIIFKLLLFERIINHYPSFEEFYSFPVYAAIISVYLLLSVIILTCSIIPLTKTDIKEMLTH